MARIYRGGRGGCTGDEGRRTQRHHSELIEDWDSGRGWQGEGGGRYVRGCMHREERIPGQEKHGAKRDLGAGRGRQIEEATGKGKVGIGSRDELLWAGWRGREAKTSGGGRRTGELSRWTVAPRLGEIRGGEEAITKREISGVKG